MSKSKPFLTEPVLGDASLEYLAFLVRQDIESHNDFIVPVNLELRVMVLETLEQAQFPQHEQIKVIHK